jgi:hypothetical protein
MLRNYRSNLEIRFQTIDKSSLRTENQKKLYATVKEMLRATSRIGTTEENPEWDQIYKIERLIFMLYSGTQLKQETMTQLQALLMKNQTDGERLRKDYETLLKLQSDNPAPGGDDEVLRNYLLRVMEAIHWNAEAEHLGQTIRTAATKIVTAGVVISFVLWVAPFIFLTFDFDSAGLVHRIWALFPYYVALTSGLFGAFFSRLLVIQRLWSKMTLDEVLLQRDLSYTLMRAGVGVSGAFLVLVFLRTELFSSPLFPGFDEVGVELTQYAPKEHFVRMVYPIPSKALALLMTFCFIAGFSEMLVPSMLASTERQFSQSSTSALKNNSGAG